MEETGPAWDLVGMRRCLALLLLVLCPAVAAAGARAGKPVRFRVTIDASRTTTWSVDGSTTSGSCTVLRGSGGETTTFKTAKPQTVGLPGLQKPLSSPLSIVVRSTRRASLTETFVSGCNVPPGGLCHPSGGDAFSASFGDPNVGVPCDSTLTADASGCGTKDVVVPSGSGLYLGYDQEGGFDVQLVVEVPLWRGDCPAVSGRRPWGVTESTSLPLAKLLRQRVTVLHGARDGLYCGSTACPLPPYDITTRAEYTVRLERVS